VGDNWAGRGFSHRPSNARRLVEAVARDNGQELERRTRRIEVPRLPVWGQAPAGSALSFPRGQHAVIHFYATDGSYLHTSVVRSGGITMMWEGARYWRAEAIPLTYDET
jgi:hypothetical protein